MYSDPIHDRLSGGLNFEGQIVVKLLVDAPLGSNPNLVGEVYLYAGGIGCNGATDLIRIGFDPSRNPTAGQWELESCANQVDRGPLAVLVYARSASELELLVLVPRDVVEGGDDFNWLGRVCDGPACTNGSVLPVDGEDFDAALLCHGRRVTMAGTERDDRIRGSDRGDVIRTYGGDDQVWAGKGYDVVCLDEGEDTGRGQRGRDHVYGGPGPDTIYLGKGDDHGYGDAGRDDIAGGPGDDFIRGDKGKDYLSGGSGSDGLYGGGNDDRLFGGSGPDVLAGESGNDKLRGGNGRDHLYGDSTRHQRDSGDDRLWGGGHRDLFAGGPGDDVCRGGGGIDGFFKDHPHGPCETNIKIP